jgi:hypothetical protein
MLAKEKVLAEQRFRVYTINSDRQWCRIQREDTDAARYSCSAVFHRLDIGFHPSTHATILGIGQKG